MERQKRTDSGITLVALVVSIIVMLVLAGVSLNATVGENGIVTRAQEAKKAQEKAQEKEELEYMLANYNIDSNKFGTMDEYIQSLIDEGKIDKFSMIPDPTNPSKRVRMIKKGETFYYVLETGEYYKLQEINTDLSGDISNGYTIVTAKNFNGGTMNFNPGEGKSATLIFNDKIDADYNFNITTGTVTIYIDNDMTLTNQGMGRSAINIEPNAVLNLHIAKGKTLTVDSGFGLDGESRDNTSTEPAKGGAGGFAGIRVPNKNGAYATLNLYDEGTLIAIGGNAGNGGDGYGHPYGGGGGGGAGAGIGGNGGEGGGGAGTVTGRGLVCSGWDGKAGEDCGHISINDDVKVYAYGGSGGSGGKGKNSTGGGGAGYPAAGIGGGGAGGGGGDHADGGGGFSGGSGEEHTNLIGINGLSGAYRTEGSEGPGAGYYEEGTGSVFKNKGVGQIGGQGGKWYANTGWDGSQDYMYYVNAKGGDGGKAGNGGDITYSKIDNIYAYNGNQVTVKGTEDIGSFYLYSAAMNSDNKTSTTTKSDTLMSSITTLITDDSGNYKKIVPTMIFAQSGICREIYTTNIRQDELDKITYENNYSIATSVSDTISIIAVYAKTINVTGYNNGYMENQGIGSGAGYLEASNGTLTQK